MLKPSAHPTPSQVSPWEMVANLKDQPAQPALEQTLTAGQWLISQFAEPEGARRSAKGWTHLFFLCPWCLLLVLTSRG